MLLPSPQERGWGGAGEGGRCFGPHRLERERGSVLRHLHLDDTPMSMVGPTMQALHGSWGSWVPSEPAFGSVV